MARQKPLLSRFECPILKPMNWLRQKTTVTQWARGCQMLSEKWWVRQKAND